MILKHTVVCILLYTSTLGWGCATFKPMGTPVAATKADSSSLSITPTEGRPQSVLLKIQWLTPSTFTHLVLYRVIPDAEPVALHTLQYSPQVLDQLREGVVISDPTIQVGPNNYTVLIMQGDRALDAAEAQFIWTQAPPPPNVSYSLIHHQVVLKWDSPDNNGAVIFRRDLLSEMGLVRIADLQPSHHGFFVDTDVNPDGVYAYRIALMETPAVNDGPQEFPRFGSPSEEIYVTVDSTPPANVIETSESIEHSETPETSESTGSSETPETSETPEASETPEVSP